MADIPVAPELQIAGDLARRAVPVGAALIVGATIGWGIDGGLSAAYAVAVVVVNFAAAAALIAWGAGRSAAALMGAVLGGYIGRLALVLGALALVQDAAWVARTPLFATVLITHVGLLVWEAKHVSASLAYPGLKPRLAHKETRPS